jgi:exopolysaccharide biosynthesis protein
LGYSFECDKIVIVNGFVGEMGVQYYLTGFDWLVYQGQPTTTSTGSPNENRAPRTAIGLDKHGHLLLLVVDGCEECFHNKGFTLDGLANLLSSHGAEYAINLDGGGSSTLVQDGHVLNVPTCLDIPVSCQRPVATIVCLQDTGANSKSQ